MNHRQNHSPRQFITMPDDHDCPTPPTTTVHPAPIYRATPRPNGIPILSESEREFIRWYWVESRTIAEIAELIGCSRSHVRNELVTIRRIIRSHGQDLPKFNHGRPRLAPCLPVEAMV